MVADRRAARTSRHPDAPASGLAEWLADRQQQADLHAERARASEPDPAASRQQPGAPPAEPVQRDSQDQERDWQDEDDFSDSWHSYRERAEQIRQTHGWAVPEPPSRADLGCRSVATTTRSATGRTADLGCSAPR